MRKSLRIASIAGAVSLLAGGAVSAADFPEWENSSGVNQLKGLTTDAVQWCIDNTGQCAATATGPGFLQFQLTTATGQNFIVTNIEGDGGFVDQSMVMLGDNATQATTNGIRTLQSINAPSNTGDFTSNTEITSGWGTSDDSGQSVINIAQSITDPGTTGNVDAFNTRFNYLSRNEGTAGQGALLGKDIVITQSNELGNADSDLAFALRDRSGIYLGAGSVTGDADPNTVDEQTGTLSWDGANTATGQAWQAKAIFIGQTVTFDQQGGGFGAQETHMGYVAFSATDRAGNTVLPVGDTVPTNSPGISSMSTGVPAAAQNPVLWHESFNGFTLVGQDLDNNGVDDTSGNPCLTDPSGVLC